MLVQAPDQLRARELILRYGWNSTAFQILNPGIQRWFSETEEAVIGYVTSGGFRVVAGEPVCPPDRLNEIVATFETQTRQQGLRVCYFCVQDRLVRLLSPGGSLNSMPIGAQSVWNPQEWYTIIQKKSSLRAQLARARNKDVVVRKWSTEQATNHPALARCLDEWLQTRGLPPMHFLVEPDTLGCLKYRHIHVAEQSGRVVGFLVASPIPLRNGYLIEQVIRGSQAPNGTAELLIDAAMRCAASKESSYVTLGLSPLSRRAGIPLPLQPLWLRVLFAWTREHGRRFYNFEGLDSFKAKLMPAYWEPIYAITSEPYLSPQMIHAIAGAFSGMSPFRFVGRGLLRALKQEMIWMRHKFSH